MYTQTPTHRHTQGFFFAPAHRKDCNNKDSKDRNHRSAMQASLLLFGLLFRPGASVRLKTVGESWEGPTLDTYFSLPHKRNRLAETAFLIAT